MFILLAAARFLALVLFDEDARNRQVVRRCADAIDSRNRRCTHPSLCSRPSQTAVDAGRSALGMQTDSPGAPVTDREAGLTTRSGAC